MRRIFASLAMFGIIVTLARTGWALVEVGNDTNNADEYFTERQKTKKSSLKPAPDRLLGIYAGAFYDDSSYKWGADKESKVGNMSVGFTYLLSSWAGSSDVSLRVDYSTYGLAEGTASKMAFMPMVSIPDAKSRFPLYFGAAIGPGIFFKQLENESTLAIDYQILAGVRLLDLIGNTGFFIEVGWKNHFNLLSDGQFNGSFASIGTDFTF